jgi:hypothetical protein
MLWPPETSVTGGRIWEITTHYWCGLCEWNSAEEAFGEHRMWMHIKTEHIEDTRVNEATFEVLAREGPDDEGRSYLRFKNGDEVMHWHPFVSDDD